MVAAPWTAIRGRVIPLISPMKYNPPPSLPLLLRLSIFSRANNPFMKQRIYIFAESLHTIESDQSKRRHFLGDKFVSFFGAEPDHKL